MKSIGNPLKHYMSMICMLRRQGLHDCADPQKQRYMYKLVSDKALHDGYGSDSTHSRQNMSVL
jgi:hypothetical protein